MRRGDAVELIRKVARAPTAALRHARVHRALAGARARTAMDVAVLGEVHEGHEVVRFMSGDGASFGLAPGVSLPLEVTFCERLLDGRLSGIVRDARTDDVVRDLELTRIAEVGAYIGVPLTGLDARLYVLCCLAHEQRQQLSAADLAFLRSLGQSILAELDTAPVTGG